MPFWTEYSLFAYSRGQSEISRSPCKLLCNGS